jgi:uncharacterized protein YjbI with pentapeptide repeats
LFANAKMAEVVLQGSKLKQALFVEADLSVADLRDCDLEMSIFQRAKCQGAKFSGSVLTYADFSHADVSMADFTGAQLFRARLHGTNQENTRWGAARAVALGDEADLAEAEAFQPKAPETYEQG